MSYFLLGPSGITEATADSERARMECREQRMAFGPSWQMCCFASAWANSCSHTRDVYDCVTTKWGIFSWKSETLKLEGQGMGVNEGTAGGGQHEKKKAVGGLQNSDGSSDQIKSAEKTVCVARFLFSSRWLSTDRRLCKLVHFVVFQLSHWEAFVFELSSQSAGGSGWNDFDV